MSGAPFRAGDPCLLYDAKGRTYLIELVAGRTWEYTLQEAKRPGQSFPIIEEEGKTSLLNSKDLNLIRHLPELIAAGVNSLKIEGRMKSLYYVAAVTRTYREALDCYREDPAAYRFRESWSEELEKISHRPYTTGFLFPEEGTPLQSTAGADYLQSYDFVGIVEKVDEKGAKIEARNKILPGDRIEWIGPGTSSFETILEEIRDLEGTPLPCAQPQQTFVTPMTPPIAPFFLLRRKKVSRNAIMQKTRP